MKKILFLLVVVVLFLPSCKSWLVQPSDVGKTFGISVPRKVPIYKEPSLKAEKFYLKEPGVFVTEDAVCEGNTSWWGNCILIITEMPEKGFLKVKFDSGKVGYVNFSFFFPKYSYLITDEIAAVSGETVRSRIARYLKENKEGQEKVMMALKKREETIKTAPWPEDIKELVFYRELKIGLTKEQVMLSQNPPDRPAFKGRRMKKVAETVTEKGMIEKWTLDDVITKKNKLFYFLDDKLTRWEVLTK
ncbi:MAG: hypothetical protein KAT46_03050 [Deltaproteobacteria bacterium]|nr:hypothetical protein [Deltaproteobacteria bacterium]